MARAELDLKASLPEWRRTVLKGKRLLLLSEMLSELQYPDAGVVEDIKNGYDLVGVLPASSVLPLAFTPATLSESELLESAPAANQAIFESTRSCGDPEVDQELWRKTQKEVAVGWLEGPIPFPRIASTGRVARRFGIVQGSKTRPIDNYSESQVNDSCTFLSRITVDGVDTVSAMGALYMRRLSDAGNSTRLCGRSFDLRSAYRQLCVSDASLKWARVVVFDPNLKVPVCYQQYTLPFGARASVLGFIRCARMLQWIAHSIDLVVSCYFDDYVCMSTPELATNSEQSFACLLDLLGWEYDCDGAKNDEMSDTVSALGVEFDLRDTHLGTLKVRNTARRVVELQTNIDEPLRRGSFTGKEAASLKGRLGFASGQLFGRTCRKLIQDLGTYSLTCGPFTITADTVKPALVLLQHKLASDTPRLVHIASSDTFYIYTDAFFEMDQVVGGLGGC